MGLLQTGDNAAIYALKNLLDDKKENEVIKFECAKSLVILGTILIHISIFFAICNSNLNKMNKKYFKTVKGDWSNNVCDLFSQNLTTGNEHIKNEIFKCIINSKNPQFTDLV